MKLGIVTETFADWPLARLLDWLAKAAPAVTALELGAGGYAPTAHCDVETLLHEQPDRRRWQEAISVRGFEVAALNAWGNPLHPDQTLARRHDADLRRAIRLAAMLGVDRVLALAGCPAAAPGDRSPSFAAGGWLPYLEEVWERQWEEVALPYWTALAEFARREHPNVLVCVELHPGTLVYNLDTFARFAAAGDNLAANIDPSHFAWQGIDALALVEQLPGRIGHAHAKDVVFDSAQLALNGVLDRRAPAGDAASWRFAVVGRGRDAGWWHALLAALEQCGVPTVAIEHEDPAVAAESGVVEAADLLAAALEPNKEGRAA